MSGFRGVGRIMRHMPIRHEQCTNISAISWDSQIPVGKVTFKPLVGAWHRTTAHDESECKA